VTDLATTIHTNPQAFLLFIQWAYEHHLDAASSSLADLISVWILANKLSIPELQNFAISAIFNSNPGDSLVEQGLYEYLEKHSKTLCASKPPH
jgi:hypothetical protein